MVNQNLAGPGFHQSHGVTFCTIETKTNRDTQNSLFNLGVRKSVKGSLKRASFFFSSFIVLWFVTSLAFIMEDWGTRLCPVSTPPPFLDSLGVLYSQLQTRVFFFFSVTIIIPVRPVASVVLVQWEPSVSACCSHSFRFAAFPLKRTHAGLPYRAQSKSSSTGEQNRSAFKSGFTFEGFWSLLHGRWTPTKIDCTAIIITFFFFQKINAWLVYEHKHNCVRLSSVLKPKTVRVSWGLKMYACFFSCG